MGALRTVLRWVFRGALTLAALIVLAVVAFGIWDVSTYDAAAWRRDYEHLKAEMAQNYANLDWLVEHRDLDLQALDAETGAAIDNAHSRVRAFLALRRFLRAFDDPHLRFARRERAAPIAENAPQGAPAPEPAVGDCEQAGYETGDAEFVHPLNQMPGWTPLRDAPFPSALVDDLGILRIAAFGEDQYLPICEAVFAEGMDEWTLRLAVRARLQQELRRALADLKQRGAQRLLVDLTGNGGGTEWVDEVIQLMTDRELTRASARMIGPSCDRSGIWRGEPVCPVLAPAGEPARLTGTGEWTGPVFILVDGATASASEDFVAWLQQNGVARVVGARTMGAGCGYIDGGGRITLEAVPLDVMAPNCARLLDNGVNEIEGIAPDSAIDMDASAALWIESLTEALGANPP